MFNFGLCPLKNLTIMKKILTTLAILAAFAVTPANAQFKFGVKGGFNNTSMKFDLDQLSNKSGFGWFLGPTAKFTFPVGVLSIGADAAVFYDERSSKAEVNGIEESIKRKSILIPINARVNFSIIKVLGAYVATGPQFGFNVGKSDVNLLSASSVSDHFQLRKSQFSWNVGVGLIALKHIEVGVTYNIGIGRTGSLKEMDQDDIIDTPKQNSWMVSAAYYF